MVTDRRWTIVAAVGINTAVMLVHGLAGNEPERHARVPHRCHVALPSGVLHDAHLCRFLRDQLPAERRTLERLSTVCQIIAYASLLGLAIL